MATLTTRPIDGRPTVRRSSPTAGTNEKRAIYQFSERLFHCIKYHLAPRLLYLRHLNDRARSPGATSGDNNYYFTRLTNELCHKQRRDPTNWKRKGNVHWAETKTGGTETDNREEESVVTGYLIITVVREIRQSWLACIESRERKKKKHCSTGSSSYVMSCHFQQRSSAR